MNEWISNAGQGAGQSGDEERVTSDASAVVEDLKLENTSVRIIARGEDGKGVRSDAAAAVENVKEGFCADTNVASDSDPDAGAAADGSKVIINQRLKKAAGGQAGGSGRSADGAEASFSSPVHRQKC